MWFTILGTNCIHAQSPTLPSPLNLGSSNTKFTVHLRSSHDPQWESESLFSEVGLAWKTPSCPKQNPIMSFLEARAVLTVLSEKCHGEVNLSDCTWSLRPKFFYMGNITERISCHEL